MQKEDVHYVFPEHINIPIPSVSVFSVLTGLVGELDDDDFLPLRPEIIAIEDSLPMARTAFPVFYNTEELSEFYLTIPYSPNVCKTKS